MENTNPNNPNQSTQPSVLHEDLMQNSKTKEQTNSKTNHTLHRHLKRALKSRSAYACCPFCNHSSMTVTQKSCSPSSAVSCIAGGVILWLIVQAIRGKDLNCENVRHFCSNCNKEITEYRSCC